VTISSSHCTPQNRLVGTRQFIGCSGLAKVVYVVQILNEVTDNIIYTYKSEVIVACGRNKGTGSKGYLSSLMLWPLSLEQWKGNIYLALKKEKDEAGRT
jgi:hypothetical protein